MSEYPHIASRQNALVKRFRDAAEGAADGAPLLLDGEHLVDAALASHLAIETLAIEATRVAGPAAALAGRAQASGARVVTASSAVIAALSPVRHPSGVVALVRHVPATLEAVAGAAAPVIVVIAGVQDPGNVGSIVRAAEALGATGVICTGGSADPFGWKALRGAMGSSLRLPIAVRQPTPAVTAALRAQGVRIVAAVPRDGTPLPAANLRPPVAFLVGGEGTGLDPAALAAADVRVSIPMAPAVESFNVAVAAALVLYEASRQRSRS